MANVAGGSNAFASYLLCISWQFAQINLGVISFVDAYLQSENKWNYGSMEFMLIMWI